MVMNDCHDSSGRGSPSPKATVTQHLVWKRGNHKRGILKSLVYHVLNFKSCIKLIYYKITHTYCVINESNPTFEIQNMGNEAFQNASFGNASFGNEASQTSLIYHILNFKSCIKLIYNKITYTYCITNEFNPSFETQNMGNKAFKIASLRNALFGNEDYSCLWAHS